MNYMARLFKLKFTQISQMLLVVYLTVASVRPSVRNKFFLDATSISIRGCVRPSVGSEPFVSKSSKFAFLSEKNFVVAVDEASGPAIGICWSCIRPCFITTKQLWHAQTSCFLLMTCLYVRLPVCLSVHNASS